MLGEILSTAYGGYPVECARLRLVPSSPLVDFSFDFQDLDLRPVSPDSLATR